MTSMDHIILSLALTAYEDRQKRSLLEAHGSDNSEEAVRIESYLEKINAARIALRECAETLK